MDKIMITIATDFSDTPAGRYASDGPYSGESFREEMLIPALKEGKSVVVDLDGVLGFGSSFLEEAFGGLVRKGFSAPELRSKLRIRTSLKVYADRIWRYIEEASSRAAHA